jgi:phosphate/sulfate permease
MKKLYFIVPIIGALVFFFFYSAVKNDIKAADEQRKKDQAEELDKRTKQDFANRKSAFDRAYAEAIARIEEVKKKEAEENRKAEETQDAKDARDLAYRERERQYKRLMELTDSRAVANEQLAHVQEQLALQKIQSDYFEKAAKEVVQTKANYEQALSKMEAAEKAAEVARAAAAAAARRS